MVSLAVAASTEEEASPEVAIVAVTGAVDGVLPLTRSKAVNILARPLLQTKKNLLVSTPVLRVCLAGSCLLKDGRIPVSRCANLRMRWSGRVTFWDRLQE